MTVWDNLAETEKTMPHLITKFMNEQHRELNSTEVLSNQPRQAEALVGAAKRPNVSKPERRTLDRGYERSDKRIRTACNFCGKSNHDQSTCSHRINAEAGIIEEQCSYCHNFNHGPLTCRKETSDDALMLKINKSRATLSRPKQDDFAMAADDTTSLDRNRWYADSGATHHMYHNKSLMHNFTSIPELSRALSGIGGVTLYALSQGDIHVVTIVDGTTQTTVLNNVLYVPDLGTNLLSITSATDRGLNLEFLKQTVLLKSNGTTILSGNGEGKTLYKLNISATAISSQEPQSTALKAFVKKVSLSTWHPRLSHTSFSSSE
jgi:hypothetical protein